MCIKWNLHVCVHACVLISDMDCCPFFGPASICVYNQCIYVLANYKCLFVKWIFLYTVETDVSSVGNNFTQIETWPWYSLVRYVIVNTP